MKLKSFTLALSLILGGGTNLKETTKKNISETFNEFTNEIVDRTSISQYAQESLEEIMSQQEDKIKIKFLGKPQIKCDLIGPSLAHYNTSINTIFINLNLLLTPLDVLSKKTYLNESLKKTIRIAISHELGHYYCDRKNEELGEGNWPLSEEYQKIGTRMIAEGIGMYFLETINKGIDPFANFPNTDETKVYQAGLYLVEPLIDSYGEEAIDYLMESPPTEEELLNLLEYQIKVWQELKTN